MAEDGVQTERDERLAFFLVAPFFPVATAGGSGSIVSVMQLVPGVPAS